MNYAPTGYKRGRPRKGEIRPPSPNAIAQKKYRQKRLKAEPEWRNVLNRYSRDWYAKNWERGKEIARNTARRKKRWSGQLQVTL